MTNRNWKTDSLLIRNSRHGELQVEHLKELSLSSQKGH